MTNEADDLVGSEYAKRQVADHRAEMARSEQSAPTENKPLAPHCNQRWAVYSDLSGNGIFYVNADRVEYISGAAVFWCNEANVPTLAIAPGHWSSVVAADHRQALASTLATHQA